MTLPTTAQDKSVLPEGFEDVGDGFKISYETGIDIGNMINDLQARIKELKAEKSALQESLKSERNKTEEIIEQHKKTIASLEGEIKALESLVEALEDENRNLDEINRMLKKQQFENKVAVGGISFGAGFIIGILTFMSIAN